MVALQGEIASSNFIYAKKDRNGPPSANQVSSKEEPRRGHAVCTLWVHPPTSPYLAVSAHAEPRTLPEVTSWSWKSHDGYIRYRSSITMLRHVQPTHPEKWTLIAGSGCPTKHEGCYLCQDNGHLVPT